MGSPYFFVFPLFFCHLIVPLLPQKFFLRRMIDFGSRTIIFMGIRYNQLNQKKMAKEITGYVKLQVKGGQANPAPPVGPALGS